MLLRNFDKIISKEDLEQYYYICEAEEAKKLFLLGCQPIAIDKAKNYIFFKTKFLKKYLKKGGVE